ncbi:OLFR [Mytilus edulis]|uniref:OLFR n=1 Tax=Mytilus edulis TaxID=6550 RepID=A0A8S3UDW6_MYTED|nr:OLFR [Mytilus edulis]
MKSNFSRLYSKTMLNLTHNESVFTYSAETNSVVMIGLSYVLGTVFILINLPSVIIVLCSFCRRNDLKNMHVLFSLSITDMLFGFIWFLVIDINVNKNNIPYTECVVRLVIVQLSHLVSNVHLFNITLDRICTVCLNAKLFINHRGAITILTVIGSWIFSAGSLVLFQILNGRDSGEQECSISRVMNPGFPYVATLLALIQIGSISNVIVMIVFLIRHQNLMKATIRIDTGRKTSKSDIRLCVTVCIVSIVCTLLNLPWTVLLLYGSIVEWPSRFVLHSTFFLSSLTALVNPILYTYRTRKFRVLLQESTQLLNCCRK